MNASAPRRPAASRFRCTCYRLAATFGLFAPATLLAATCHVWQDSPTPGAPYDTWETAAHGVQEAVAYAQDNIGTYNTVLVTNGVYAVTNAQLLVNQPLAILSVEGAEKTAISTATPARQARECGSQAAPPSCRIA